VPEARRDLFRLSRRRTGKVMQLFLATLLSDVLEAKFNDAAMASA
jgi:hypothetical protein